MSKTDWRMAYWRASEKFRAAQDELELLSEIVDDGDAGRITRSLLDRVGELEDRLAEAISAAKDPSHFHGAQGGRWSWEK